MAYLYILQSESTGRFYVGSTNNLTRRLEEHVRGQTASTSGRGPELPMDSVTTQTESRHLERQFVALAEPAEASGR